MLSSNHQFSGDIRWFSGKYSEFQVVKQGHITNPNTAPVLVNPPNLPYKLHWFDPTKMGNSIIPGKKMYRQSTAAFLSRSFLARSASQKIRE